MDWTPTPATGSSSEPGIRVGALAPAENLGHVYLDGSFAYLLSVPAPWMPTERGRSHAASPFCVRINGTVDVQGVNSTEAFTHFLRLVIHPTHQHYPVLRRLPRHLLRFPTWANGYLRAAATGTLLADEVEGLVQDIVRDLLVFNPPAPHLDGRVHEAMRILDIDLHRPFERLAAELGTSGSRLSHLFTQEVGISYRQYVLWSRTMTAWEGVAFDRQRLLTDVAHRTGFTDSAHMTRAFQRFFTVAPTMMRDTTRWRYIGRPEPVGRRVPAPLV